MKHETDMEALIMPPEFRNMPYPPKSGYPPLGPVWWIRKDAAVPPTRFPQHAIPIKEFEEAVQPFEEPKGGAQ